MDCTHEMCQVLPCFPDWLSLYTLYCNQQNLASAYGAAGIQSCLKTYFFILLLLFLQQTITEIPQIVLCDLSNGSWTVASATYALCIKTIVCLNLLILKMQELSYFLMLSCLIWQVSHWKRRDVGSFSHSSPYRISARPRGHYCRDLWRPKCNCKRMERESCRVWFCLQWESSYMVLGQPRYSTNVCKWYVCLSCIFFPFAYLFF